eukprot:m.57276 g.57276  ORF g.57276 m.57276 type:complete len:573 (-) comp11094_c0_seq1:92-1810(-)
MGESICAKCKERITERALVIGDKHYHPGCLVCHVCDAPLDGQICDKDGEFFCLDCYRDQHAPKCAACEKAIEGSSLQVGNETFHPECFACDFCKKRIFAGSGFVRKKKGRCCAECKTMFCPVCKEYCPEDDRREVSGEKAPFHLKCLKCATCGGPQIMASAKLFNGKIYCKEHYEEESRLKVDLAKGCGRCEKPISGKAILACKRQWHPTCFTCHADGCELLLGSKFFDRAGKPYCEKHKDEPLKSGLELRSAARDTANGNAGSGADTETKKRPVGGRTKAFNPDVHYDRMATSKGQPINSIYDNKDYTKSYDHEYCEADDQPTYNSLGDSATKNIPSVIYDEPQDAKPAHKDQDVYDNKDYGDEPGDYENPIPFTTHATSATPANPLEPEPAYETNEILPAAMRENQTTPLVEPELAYEAGPTVPLEPDLTYDAPLAPSQDSSTKRGLSEDEVERRVQERLQKEKELLEQKIRAELEAEMRGSSDSSNNQLSKEETPSVNKKPGIERSILQSWNKPVGSQEDLFARERKQLPLPRASTKKATSASVHQAKPDPGFQRLLGFVKKAPTDNAD